MKKSVLAQLASSLGRKDEEPNIKLAKKIASDQDHLAVRELISLVETGSAAVRSDAIKVLYETGVLQPALISGHHKVFVNLLSHKDNRLKWGAMSALSAISSVDAKKLVPFLPDILDSMDQGTVITRDHGITILSNMAKIPKHHTDAMELLLEQIAKAPVNQVPMYAEKIAEAISAPFISRLKKILLSREDVLSVPSKEKRIRKVLKSL